MTDDVLHDSVSTLVHDVCVPNFSFASIHAKALQTQQEPGPRSKRGIALAASATLFVSLSVAIAALPPLQHELADVDNAYARAHNQHAALVHAVSLKQARSDASFNLQPPTGLPPAAKLLEIDEWPAGWTLGVGSKQSFSFLYLLTTTKQHFIITIGPLDPASVRSARSVVRREIHYKSYTVAGEKTQPLFARAFAWMTHDEVISLFQNTLTVSQIENMRKAMHGSSI